MNKCAPAKRPGRRLYCSVSGMCPWEMHIPKVYRIVLPARHCRGRKKVRGGQDSYPDIHWISTGQVLVLRRLGQRPKPQQKCPPEEDTSPGGRSLFQQLLHSLQVRPGVILTKVPVVNPHRHAPLQQPVVNPGLGKAVRIFQFRQGQVGGDDQRQSRPGPAVDDVEYLSSMISSRYRLKLSRYRFRSPENMPGRSLSTRLKLVIITVTP